MSDDSMPKIVFDELMKLDNLGFSTWVTSVKSLALNYSVDLFNSEYKDVYIQNIKRSVISQYQSKWLESINNIDQNPLLRTYKVFKKKIPYEPLP